jgi:hypothetical protein
VVLLLRVQVYQAVLEAEQDNVLQLPDLERLVKAMPVVSVTLTQPVAVVVGEVLAAMLLGLVIVFLVDPAV